MPRDFWRIFAKNNACNFRRVMVYCFSADAPVAQSDRVFGYEPKGRRFESSPACHPETLMYSGFQGFSFPRNTGKNTECERFVSDSA